MDLSAEENEFDQSLQGIVEKYQKSNPAPKANNRIAYLTYEKNECQIIELFKDRLVKIRIYIRYYESSGYIPYLYSVKGWYINESTKKKTELAGIYYYGKLVLYCFNDKSQLENVINMDELNNLDYDEFYNLKKNLKGFSHRFFIDYNKNDLTCVYNSTKSTRIYDIFYSNYYLTDASEHLNIGFNEKTQYTYNLKSLINGHSGYDIVAANRTTDTIKVLLQYNNPANENPQGICGAGYEAGFVLLEFGNDGSVINTKLLEISNCNREMTFTKLPSEVSNVHKYQTIVNEADEVFYQEFSGIVTVNLKEVTLNFEKTKK